MKSIGFWALTGLLLASSSFADGFSDRLFERTQGDYSGKFRDGVSCGMSIRPAGADGYSVVLKRLDGSSVEGVTRVEPPYIDTKEFKRSGLFKSSVEMFTGASITSRGTNSVVVYRVYFDRKGLTGYTIDVASDHGHSVCSFD